MNDVEAPLRLDCETRASAHASLTRVFGCSAQELDAFLQDRCLDAEFGERAAELPPFETFVYERACARLGSPKPLAELCWFHGTRVPAGTDFVDGIQPLGQRLDAMKKSVLATLTDEEDRQEVVRAFERKDGLSFHFKNKVADALHWGPFAMFVRDVALDAHTTSQHAYVDMPEIIEDLCAEVEAACGRNLLPFFENAWHPAVVKFVTPAFSPDFHIGVTLCYLRSCALRGRPEGSSIANFDGDNCAVPPESILKVEYL